MIRIDGNFLYQLGAEIRPLQSIHQNMTKNQVWMTLWNAETWLDALLNRSVYRLQTSWASGIALLNTIRRIKEEYGKEDITNDQKATWYDCHRISSEAKTFETILSAELQLGQLYLVEPKGGYDLNQLTDNGIVIFPRGLAEKVPEAIGDAKEVELTRFRGHFSMLRNWEVHDVPKSGVSAGIPAEADRASRLGS